MVNNIQWIVTAAAIVTAIIVLYSNFSKVVLFMERQKKQDEEIKAIKEEQTLIMYGLLACLKGLSEQGANGPVHEAIEKIEKYINQKAHS